MNKRGINLTAWNEAILIIVMLSVCFLGLGWVAASEYGASGMTAPFVDAVQLNNTINEMNASQTAMHEQINTGTPLTAFLLQLSSLWIIIKYGFTLIWNFISGNVLVNIVAAIFPSLSTPCTTTGFCASHATFIMISMVIRMMLWFGIIFAIVALLQRKKA